MSDGLDLRDRPPAGQEASDSDTPRVIGSSYTKPDRFYRGTASGAGIITLVLLVLIGTFLLIRAWPALSSQGFGFLTNTAWHPEQNPPVFGIAAVLYWTIVIAFIAMLIAVPMSILAALALTEYAPMRLRKPLTSLVDLLAAIPSLIYGLWGLFFLQEKLVPLAEWISSFFGWIPIFAVEGEQFTQSSFMAGVVVALMVLPVTTSVMREVFSQAPPGEKEAALALGNDPHRRLALRPRRNHRRIDARTRARPRRNDCSRAHHLPDLRDQPELAPHRIELRGLADRASLR